MAEKLTRMTHKIAIQLHLVAESCTICSSRSRRPVRNFWVHTHTFHENVIRHHNRLVVSNAERPEGELFTCTGQQNGMRGRVVSLFVVGALIRNQTQNVNILKTGNNPILSIISATCKYSLETASCLCHLP
jgi:hypothetical protein